MASLEKRLAKLGLVHTPTVPELAEQGLAKPIVETVGKTKRTVYKVKPKGQRLIYDAMAHNAEILRTLHHRELEARAEEKKWRAKADEIMHLHALASKGI